MSDCLFCKIVAGEIPSKKVYEDDDFYAFDDIEPETPIHTLVIPKKHYDNLQDGVPEELLGKLLKVVPEVAKIKGVGESGYRSIINTGPDSAATVAHLHVHILEALEENPRLPFGGSRRQGTAPCCLPAHAFRDSIHYGAGNRANSSRGRGGMAQEARGPKSGRWLIAVNSCERAGFIGQGNLERFTGNHIAYRALSGRPRSTRFA